MDMQRTRKGLWRLELRARFGAEETAFLRAHGSPADIVAHYPSRISRTAQYLADRAAFGESGTMDLRSGERRVPYSAMAMLKHRLFSGAARRVSQPVLRLSDLLDGFALEGDEAILRDVVAQLRRWGDDLEARMRYRR